MTEKLQIPVSCRLILTVMFKLRANGLAMSMQQSLKRMVKLNFFFHYCYIWGKGEVGESFLFSVHSIG